MQTRRFAKYLDLLEKTTSRNEITKILADLFRETKAAEIKRVVYLLTGRLAPSYQGVEFNLAEKMMIRVLATAFGVPEKEVSQIYKKEGDLGETALLLYQNQKGKKADEYSVGKAYDFLWKIAQEGGEGSQERKVNQMAHLVKTMDPFFLKYLVRIPVGKLRLGFSDKTILDALSWMKKGNKSWRNRIEAKYNVLADIGEITQQFKKYGVGGLDQINAVTGIPILPARAERLPTAEKIMEKLGICAVEPKIDGFRVQIHLSRKLGEVEKSSQTNLFGQTKHALVKIYTRNLEDATYMFPEIVQASQKWLEKDKNLSEAILDGEAVGYDPKTGQILPFQQTTQRKRKHNITELSAKVPLTVFIFDLLHYNGKSLLTEPFQKRRQLLEKILSFPHPVLRLTEQKLAKNATELKKIFRLAVKQRYEGVMCKKLDTPYQAGMRNFNWVKYKKSMESKLVDTIDCLVMGYYRGRGKRAGFGIGAFLVGVYDKEKDSFETVAKIGTGLSDEQWRQLRQRCDQVKTNLLPKQYLVHKNLFPDIWCLPQIVVEIKADEITVSPIHTAGKSAGQGLALRFPRLEKFRDKKATDVTSISELLKLAKMQR